MSTEREDNDMTAGIVSHGREVTVTVEGAVDGCGQFRVALSVDGKERFAARFTDKSEDVEEPAEAIDKSGWPEHLRDDAPYKTCDTCGRKSWSPETRVGTSCGMPQPSGPSCEGHFVERA